MTLPAHPTRPSPGSGRNPPSCPPPPPCLGDLLRSPGVGVGTGKNTANTRRHAEEHVPSPGPRLSPTLCGRQGHPKAPMRITGPDAHSHPPLQPRAGVRGAAHLVIVFVDILVELVQGHSCPKVSRVVLGKTERAESDEGCLGPRERLGVKGTWETEAGTGTVWGSRAPLQTGIPGQARPAGDKGASLVERSQVCSFSRVCGCTGPCLSAP